MSWVIAFVGFALLIILHEFGHFVAAKWVGMRVERFALFFPPLIWRKKRGETEYAIGSIPLGGYVRISGMNPSEDLPEEVRDRAYHAQAPWKRMVVIVAGPLMNVIVALILMFVFFWSIGPRELTQQGRRDPSRLPGKWRCCKPGDEIVSVDGKTGGPEEYVDVIASHECPGEPSAGCKASTPATAGDRARRAPADGRAPARVRRGGGADAARLRIRDGPRDPASAGQAVTESLDQFWFITRETVKLPARLLDPEDRKEISGVVGSYETTRQVILDDLADVLGILAIISLSLAIVNLFPFLPLDGGHIFWAVVEAVRRKPVPFAVMERSGSHRIHAGNRALLHRADERHRPSLRGGV